MIWGLLTVGLNWDSKYKLQDFWSPEAYEPMLWPVEPNAVCIFQINCLSQGPDLRPEPYMISDFLKVMDYVSLFQVTVQYLDHKYSNAVLE